MRMVTKLLAGTCFILSFSAVSHAQTTDNVANGVAQSAGYISGNALFNGGKTGAQVYYNPSTGNNYGDSSQGVVNFLTGNQNIYGAVNGFQNDYRTQNTNTQDQNKSSDSNQSQDSTSSSDTDDSSKTSGQSNTTSAGSTANQTKSPDVTSANSIMDEAIRSGEQREKARLQMLKKIHDKALEEKLETSLNAKNSKTKIEYFSGWATALDGITLAVAGKQIILNDIKAPGNNQNCYHYGVPWQCGVAARNALANLVKGEWVHCATEGTGSNGICEINGQDLSFSMASTGYAIGTNPYTEKATIVARAEKRGLWESQ